MKIVLCTASLCLLAALLSREQRPQLAPAREPKVQGRANPLGGERQAVAGRVADEEDAVLGALA